MAGKPSLPKKSKTPALASKRKNYWPLYVAAGALALIVVGILFLRSPGTQPTGSTPAQSGGPRLAVDQEKVDFGQVQVNNMVKASFKLSNVGDQPLQIAGEPVVQVVKGC